MFPAFYCIGWILREDAYIIARAANTCAYSAAESREMTREYWALHAITEALATEENS